VTPSSSTVTPGQSAAFTVNTQAFSGFNGAVSLSVSSENGFPTGISSGGFSPASIAGAGSATLTMNTTTSAVPYALSLTITGISGSITHTASTTLLVNLAAPAGLTVTSVSSGQVSLSWPAVTGASSYHVKRALVSGGPYIGVACTTSTTYTDTGVTNGTTYYYVVSAGYTAGPNAGGESADSGQVNATPLGSPPAAPMNLTASPGNPKGSLRLNWVQSASPGVTQNNIYRRTTTGSYPSTPTAKISATTTYLDNKLTSGASYCSVVTAVSGGGESPRSNEACANAK
jgi:fibronectin type 3 domain-containing protein